MINHPCDLPGHKLTRLVKRKELSAVAIVDSVFARIKSVDGEPGKLDYLNLTREDKEKVHAFISLTEDRAYQAAERIDKKIEGGKEAGPMAGIPISVKDIFLVKGTRTTAGSRILSSFVAPYTATCVEMLEAADAIVIGKTNLDEFTFGSSCESSAFKPTPRNPWSLDRVPGGSSGGSAAAVAAGEGSISIGSDTAGSVRQPASFCGVVGFKPTYGRVSRHGLIAFGSSLDCPGPISNNVIDAAIALQTMAGKDSRDPTTITQKPEDYLAQISDGVEGMRIGISEDYFRIIYKSPGSNKLRQEPISKEIKATVENAARTLESLGAKIIEVNMPHTRYGIPAYFVISRVEAASNLHRFDGVKYGFRTEDSYIDLNEMYSKTRAQGFGSQPILRILMGMYVSAAQYSEDYYRKALKLRSLIRSDFEEVFKDSSGPQLDALMTPTNPTVAFPINEVYGDSVLMQYADQFTVPANHAGIPGISIPAGLSESKLPIGVQLLGPDFSEETLFRIARAHEIATQNDPWRSATPPAVEGLRS